MGPVRMDGVFECADLESGIEYEQNPSSVSWGFEFDQFVFHVVVERLGCNFASEIT